MKEFKTFISSTLQSTLLSIGLYTFRIERSKVLMSARKAGILRSWFSSVHSRKRRTYYFALNNNGCFHLFTFDFSQIVTVLYLYKGQADKSAPPQNSRCQSCDIKRFPHWRPTNIRRHGTKFSCPGAWCPGRLRLQQGHWIKEK